jgi:hypothetical protein
MPPFAVAKRVTLRMQPLAIAALVVGMLTASPAYATTINFDSLAEQTILTNQFPELTFSSLTAGREIRAASFSTDWGTSLPNIMCSQTIGAPSDCVGDIQIDFTSPVSGLTFLSTGDDSVLAAAALVDVYVNFVLAATIPIATDGSVFVPQLLDLSAFSSVTRIVIRNQVDPAGLGFDDFTFTAEAVPEPATMLLLGAGLGAVAARRRLKKRTT